ncbi:hypothetical protein J5893_05530, partial [bacterium]|nr:hypothetical protein [bacterium]
MKDLFKRIVSISIFGAFLAYLLYLLVNYIKTNGEIMLTTPEYASLNIPLFIILIGVCIYLIVFYGMYPIHIKFSRSTLFVIGLALVILAQTILANNGPEHIYVGDFFSVMGVLILILIPTNVLTTDKVKKSKS